MRRILLVALDHLHRTWSDRERPLRTCIAWRHLSIDKFKNCVRL
jgi:hypothetical protein